MSRLRSATHAILKQPGLSTAGRSPERRDRRLWRRSALVCLAAIPAPLAVHAQSPQLTAVFAQMDAASKRFQSATANVERDNYERVVKETTVEKGTMFLERTHSGIEFGATVAGAGASSPSRIVNFNAGTLQLYTPAEKQVDVFKAGANQSKLEGYFALGFGGTSRDLQQSWNITDAGPETLPEGGQQVRTEKLVLVSKDPAAQNTFKQITLWLDPTRDVSLKQLFETPSGDTQTALYSNIRLNTKPNKAAYKIPSGKGITIVPH